MKNLIQLMLLLSIFLYACDKGKEEDHIEKWKNEILETEKDFAAMAQKEGISEAFLFYAAEDAVLMRNNSLIIGIEALQESFKKEKSNGDKVSLDWKPDFVDVALSGDLGYTYGKYTYITTDSIGKTKEVEGVFHTVWKRQADGKWKFVWD